MSMHWMLCTSVCLPQKEVVVVFPSLVVRVIVHVPMMLDVLAVEDGEGGG